MAEVVKKISQKKPGRAALLAAILVSGAFTSAAVAQEGRVHLRLLGIQSATVAPHGVGFAALSLTNKRAPGDNSNDGSAVLGFGLGDAENSVGVQLNAHITSLTDDFGDSGYLSIKASRRLSAGQSPVYGSLIFGQLANWGDANPRDANFSAAITRFTWVNNEGSGRAYPLMMTLGAGTDLRNNDTDPGVFAGIGVGLSENMSASLAWTGESVTVGTGFKIRGLDDIGFGLAIDDALNQVDNRRLILSIGYRFNNLFGG